LPLAKNNTEGIGFSIFTIAIALNNISEFYVKSAQLSLLKTHQTSF